MLLVCSSKRVLEEMSDGWTDHVGELLGAEAVQLQEGLSSHCQQEHRPRLMSQHSIPAQYPPPHVVIGFKTGA